MRPSTKKWILLVASLAVWGGAGMWLRPLNAMRAQYHLFLPPLPDEMAPSMLATPLLAFGRAPLVSYLWQRAMFLKEEGRFFDALQLSQQICKLQPKFASVWAFQAWNMAYNISVTLKTPEERWRWVRNGYELLRDKGIPLNPNNAQLYRELAWILFHKVGDFMDDWHFYYKNQFALQMEDILGVPPPEYVIPGRVRDDFYRDYDYKSLAAMPERYEQFVEDEEVATFVEQLEEFGFEPSDAKAYLGLLKSVRENKLEMPGTPAHLQEDRRQAFLKIFNDPENAEARNGLEKFWRAYRLRNEVKLDPQRIVELQQGFGVTLDFRVAETHSLYWASLGLEMGTDRREAIDIHKLNTNRIEFYCLQKMFHRGRLTMSRMADLGQPPILEPDIRVIPSLFRAFINDSEKYRDMEVNPDQKVSENFRTGFVGFMRAAILAYHERDMDREANELFTYLKNSFPDPMYEDGIEGFLAKQMIPDKELGDYRVTYRRMESLIVKGLENFAYDEDDQAVRYLGRAKQVYDHYQKTIVSERMGLQAGFDEIVRNITHVIGGRMPREIYEHLCGKLNIAPLPAASETQPATMPG